MSGSEGPDYRTFGGIGGKDCSGIHSDKPLQAPNAGVVNGLSINDELSLLLHDSEQPVIAVVTINGDEAGAVIPDQALIDCLRSGVRFHATVKSIHGGHVMLAVSAE